MREIFSSRYIFKGNLVLESALHIGGGKLRYTSSDSPVIRTVEGIPFIPGSSLKGAFRALVEKMASSIPHFYACQLLEGNGECPSANQEHYHKERKKAPEDQFIRGIYRKLCSPCRTFGSPFTASTAYFQDLYLAGKDFSVQVRDGVAIDRDSETAVDQAKYDYEVVEAGASFDLEILLDSPGEKELSLACLGVGEMVAGLFYLGGMRSRGLGKCRLEDLQVYSLELFPRANGQELDEAGRLSRLSRYLKGRTLAEKMEAAPDPGQFLEEQVLRLLDT